MSWKAVGKFLLGIGKSGLVPLPGLPAAIEAVEAAVPAPGSGATKKQIVENVADAILTASSDLGAMTEEQAAKLREIRSRYIDLYVQARNVEAQFAAVSEELQAAINDIKASHASSGSAS